MNTLGILFFVCKLKKVCAKGCFCVQTARLCAVCVQLCAKCVQNFRGVCFLYRIDYVFVTNLCACVCICVQNTLRACVRKKPKEKRNPMLTHREFHPIYQTILIYQKGSSLSSCPANMSGSLLFLSSASSRFCCSRSFSSAMSADTDSRFRSNLSCSIS